MTLELSGLDGKNPLAFLAALGFLNILSERARGGKPKLEWSNRGVFRPVLVDGPERDVILDLLVEDQLGFKGEVALDVRYSKANGSEAHDLKPPPADRILYLKRVRAGARRSMDLATSFFTDVIQDNSGNTKPTALHFTAGQQEFLSMVTVLQESVTRADFEEALFGPWQYARPLPVLQWDNSQSRDYALRATDPSKDKKQGVPGADWLAFRGMPLLPTAPIRVRGEPVIATTGCWGSWKNGTFRWPMWRQPLPVRVIQSLLASEELFSMNRAVLEHRGIAVVFESAIARSDQGGYGSFSPAGIAERRE